jgi:excisionase family DNA binding protein
MCADQLLTTSAVARELRLSEAAVRKLANLGRLPVQRTTSGTRLFRRGDVDDYARDAAERRPTPVAAEDEAV